MSLNEFAERFHGLTDQELAAIVSNQQDYRPEVFELALREFESRNIPRELAKDMSIVQLEQSEEVALVKAQKLKLIEKVIFVLLPLMGFADVIIRAAEGSSDPMGNRMSESLIFSGVGAAIWLIMVFI